MKKEEVNIKKSTRSLTGNFYIVTPKPGTDSEKRFRAAGYKNGVNVGANNERAAFKAAKRVIG